MKEFELHGVYKQAKQKISLRLGVSEFAGNRTFKRHNMKTKRMRWSWLLEITLTLAILWAQGVHAQSPPDPWPSLPTPLDSWSFTDNTNWTDDNGRPPVSFTNIASSELGNGYSLVVETNVAAWLNYPIYATNGATNIVINGSGSICFWYGGGWATTNGGPGQWAQLVDCGEWTTNSAVGYFGLSIDPWGSNVWFFSQDGLGDTYSLAAPISWTTNYFHFLAITYSSTNVSLYLDGQLATNGPGGLSVWPGTAALQNGVYFGSDTNGNFLADGLFDWVQAFGTVLDSNMVAEIYDQQVFYYELLPWNGPYMSALGSADSGPSTNSPDPNVITGSGYLQWDGVAANCAYNATNADIVWITNLVATMAGSNDVNVTFSIDGGQSGYLYDVFATSGLEIPLTNAVWAWFGQALAGNTYTITNIASSDAILILGTPFDPETNNLTAAYSSLILHLNPYVYDQDGSGLSDGAQVLLGLNPVISQVAQPGTSSIYSYTAADWINGVSGIRNGSVTMDPEGNVTQVSE